MFVLLQAVALAAMEVLSAYRQNGAGCIVAKSWGEIILCANDSIKICYVWDKAFSPHP